MQSVHGKKNPVENLEKMEENAKKKKKKKKREIRNKRRRRLFDFRSFRKSYVLVPSHEKRKKNTLINSYANYHREMKLLSINMDYCLFQFNALRFVLGVRPHEVSVPNFNFFNVKPRI